MMHETTPIAFVFVLGAVGLLFLVAFVGLLIALTSNHKKAVRFGVFLCVLPIGLIVLSLVFARLSQQRASANTQQLASLSTTGHNHVEILPKYSDARVTVHTSPQTKLKSSRGIDLDSEKHDASQTSITHVVIDARTLLTALKSLAKVDEETSASAARLFGRWLADHSSPSNQPDGAAIGLTPLITSPPARQPLLVAAPVVQTIRSSVEDPPRGNGDKNSAKSQSVAPTLPAAPTPAVVVDVAEDPILIPTSTEPPAWVEATPDPGSKVFTSGPFATVERCHQDAARQLAAWVDEYVQQKGWGDEGVAVIRDALAPGDLRSYGQFLADTHISEVSTSVGTVYMQNTLAKIDDSASQWIGDTVERLLAGNQKRQQLQRVAVAGLLVVGLVGTCHALLRVPKRQDQES